MACRACASCFSRKNRAMASWALSQRPRAWTSLSPQTPVMLNCSSTWPARSATAMRISPRTLALSPLSGISCPDRGGDLPREIVGIRPLETLNETCAGLALLGEARADERLKPYVHPLDRLINVGGGGTGALCGTPDSDR